MVSYSTIISYFKDITQFNPQINAENSSFPQSYPHYPQRANYIIHTKLTGNNWIITIKIIFYVYNCQ
jgi:hypothetical protein